MIKLWNINWREKQSQLMKKEWGGEKLNNNLHGERMRKREDNGEKRKDMKE